MILFDLTATQPNSAGKRHGGGKYGEVVLKKMIERHIPLVGYYDSKQWMNPEIKDLLARHNIKLEDVSLKSLETIVSENRVSLLYSALLSKPHLTIDKCEVVVTIHGLRHLETPKDEFAKKYRKKCSIFDILRKLKKYFFAGQDPVKSSELFYTEIISKKNFHIVTVSNHTAASFKSYFPNLRNVNIPVYYSPSTVTEKVERKIYQEKYFLLVNGNRWMKNNLRAIIALDTLFSDGYLAGYRVKITGVSDCRQFRYDLKNSEKFDFLDYVDEKTLSQLFHDAYCLIYPSLNEGFGYPPLEAMCYGVPVIASPFSSIPEICGGAVMYTNPLDVYEIKNRIIQILNESCHTHFSTLALAQFELITKKQNDDLEKLVNYLETLSK